MNQVAGHVGEKVFGFGADVGHGCDQAGCLSLRVGFWRAANSGWVRSQACQRAERALLVRLPERTAWRWPRDTPRSRLAMVAPGYLAPWLWCGADFIFAVVSRFCL